MRIGHSPIPNPDLRGRETDAPARTSIRAESGDVVTLSVATSELATATVPDPDTRIEALRQAIEAGSYPLNYEELASAIVQDERLLAGAEG